MKTNPLLMTDFYKIDHRRQYPIGTNLVYSNFTARSGDHYEGSSKGIIFFGLQYFIKKFLIDDFNEFFFSRKKSYVLEEYKRIINNCLGKDCIDYDHIESLHDVGYLPLEIKAIPEGTFLPFKIPCLTIKNTLPKFFWLVNYIETALSAELWKNCTKATIAYDFKKILNSYAKSKEDQEFVKFQAHDFSFRGMSGCDDAAISGMSHLTSFVGTDTIPSISALEVYYGADVAKELVGCSVPATEHSVMCMGIKENEKQTYKRLLTEVYPQGIVSIVSDTWDLWKVIDEYLFELKDVIMARDGKLVIRPDSGDPYSIICGDINFLFKGVLERLWDIFGGSVDKESGLKVLDSHVGIIYGDGITQQIAEKILKRMNEMGFSSRNIVFGVGSFTYQYITRDTMGFAFKSTYGEVNGVSRSIFKDPITDNNNKKSAKGLLRVSKDKDEYSLDQDVDKTQENGGELKVVFRDGKLINFQTLSQIREVIENE